MRHLVRSGFATSKGPSPDPLPPRGSSCTHASTTTSLSIRTPLWSGGALRFALNPWNLQAIPEPPGRRHAAPGSYGRCDLFTDKSASGRPRKGVLRVPAASLWRQSSWRLCTFRCVPAGSSQSRDLSAPSVGHHDRIHVVVVPLRAKVSTLPLSPFGGLRAPWPPSLLRQAPTAKSPVPSQFPHRSQASDAAKGSGQCRFPSDGLYLLTEAGARVSPSVVFKSEQQHSHRLGKPTAPGPQVDQYLPTAIPPASGPQDTALIGRMQDPGPTFLGPRSSESLAVLRPHGRPGRSGPHLRLRG